MPLSHWIQQGSENVIIYSLPIYSILFTLAITYTYICLYTFSLIFLKLHVYHTYSILLFFYLHLHLPPALFLPKTQRILHPQPSGCPSPTQSRSPIATTTSMRPPTLKVMLHCWQHKALRMHKTVGGPKNPTTWAVM